MKKRCTWMRIPALLLLSACCMLTACNKAPKDNVSEPLPEENIPTAEYQLPSVMTLRHKDDWTDKTVIDWFDVQYDGNTMTLAKKDGAKRIIELDAHGRLLNDRKYDADGSFESHSAYTYDANGNITTQIEYDENGNEKYRISYTYDEGGNLLKMENTDTGRRSRGPTVYTYDAEGRLIKEERYGSTGEFRGHDEYVYDENGVLRQETSYDSDGNVTLLEEYDEHGNQTKHLAYRDGGNLNEERSETYTHTYDAEGRETERLLYNGDGSLKWRYAYEYDAEGTLLKENLYNEDGKLIEITEYDKYGNVTRQAFSGYDIDGEDIWGVSNYRYTYDGDGRITKKEEYGDDGEVQSHTEYTYDAEGRLTQRSSDSMSGMITHRESYVYDESGHEIEYISYYDRYFEQYNERRVSEYDASGNLTQETYYRDRGRGWERSEETVYSEYDANGNAGQSVSYYYSLLHGGTWLFNKTTDARVEYVYNKDGKLISRSVYDANGLPVESETIEYDAEGREVKQELSYAEDQSTVRFESTYDANGLQTKRGYYGGTVLTLWTVQEYDAAGNLVKKTNYDSDGTTVNQIDIYTYDETGRQLTDTQYDGDGETVTYSDEQVFDANGNLIKDILYYNRYSIPYYEISVYEYDEKGCMTLRIDYLVNDAEGLEEQEWLQKFQYTYSEQGALTKEERSWYRKTPDYKYNVTESCPVTLTEAQFKQFLAYISEFIAAEE